jgi:hypothetical protein
VTRNSSVCPQQVDQLLQPAPDAAFGDTVGRAVTRAEGAVPLVEEAGDLLDLREHAAAGGLGGMGGEDRAQRNLMKIGGDVARGEPGGGDLIDSL